ncbi:MAG: J domain-containing protein [Aureliella sp.]
MSTQPPDWKLLANNPLAFFELSEDFDRKQLKRAYGRWIKRYKPESHPAEFQCIRQAYELLERGHRYGTAQIRQSSLEDAWHSASIDVASRGNSVQAAIESPKSVYAELSKSADRTAHDYFVLATLSDLVDSQPNMYVKWLLTGLKKFPDDPGLLRLIAEHLSAFAEPDTSANLLLALSKVLASGDFFRVTEQVWFRLAGDWSFTKFSKVLEACESQLRGDNLQSRIMFNIQMLRRMVLTAPQHWVQTRANWLSENGSQFSATAEEEFEFLQLLLQYCEKERGEAQSNRVSQLIDELITTYCKQPRMVAARRIAAIADELARSGNAIIDTYKYDDQSTESVAPYLCQLITSEIAVDLGIDFDPPSQRRIEQQADAVIKDLQLSFESVGRRIGRINWYYRLMPFLSVWVGPAILMSGWSQSIWWTVSAIWTPISVALSRFVIHPRWVAPKLDRQIRRLIIQEYQDVWRPRLYRYIAACNAPAQVCIENLVHSAHIASSERLADITLSYASDDPSLHLYSQLQVFVR